MTTTTKTSKAMHISLWVVQALLAAMFLMSGFMKASMPVEKLSAMLPWATSVPVALIKFIGLSELLGGLGLILPSLLRFKPTLTIWAGLGLATIMLLAIPFHISRGETPLIGMNAMFMILSLFVAWGRSKKAPILPKS
ncbi:MAG: DoxX family protein [Bacteroidia bacterium]|nr:DoxX family protein [Bacteroidia bacterium]